MVWFVISTMSLTCSATTSCHVTAGTGTPSWLYRFTRFQALLLLQAHLALLSKAAFHVVMSLQVPGCTADLSSEAKRYCWHKRICSKHMQVRRTQHALLCNLVQAQGSDCAVENKACMAAQQLRR
jgi:hypothetical protein